MAQNPNIDDDTRARAMKFVADNAADDADEEVSPKAMPRRPVSRTPVASAAPRKPAARADENYGNEGRGSKAPEARDRFGIPTSMGNAGKSYAPTGKAAESASGSETMRNLEAAGNATGASAAIQGVRRGAAFGKGVSEFAAGRKAAPEVAKAAEKVAEKAAPAVSTKRAAPNPKVMEKVNEGLRNAPRPVSKPTATQKEWAKGPRMGKLGKGAADTLDEFGGAMKRGGSVKGYAKGGSISSASSRGDGIAQRGKTRGTMMCSGGMAKGRK